MILKTGTLVFLFVPTTTHSTKTAMTERSSEVLGSASRMRPMMRRSGHAKGQMAKRLNSFSQMTMPKAWPENKSESECNEELIGRVPPLLPEGRGSIRCNMSPDPEKARIIQVFLHVNL